MIGPFSLDARTRERTGAVSVSQRYSLSFQGRRVYDLPVNVTFEDGRTVAVTSAGIPLSQNNARLFADRAYLNAAPRSLEVAEWEAAQ